MEIISKERYNKIREEYKNIYKDGQGNYPHYEGRRTLLCDGKLLIEGLHFLVEDDYSHLPTIHKENAHIGMAYRFCDGYMIVKKLELIDDEEMKEFELVYKERYYAQTFTSGGSFEIGGGLDGSQYK